MKKMMLCMLVGAVSLSATGCFRTRADIAREKEEREQKAALQQNAVEQSQNMEKLQSEIGRLQGRLEEMDHQRKKEAASFNSTVNSNLEGRDKRVSDLQGQLEDTRKAQTALFEEMKRLKEENLALLKAQTEHKEKPRPAPATPAMKKQAGSQYEAGVAAYKAKDYGSAIPVFRAYLDAQPNGKRSGDAHYFLGDSLFRTKDYSQAILAFSVVHEKQPETGLGRRATLRIAESFKALGKDKDAKAFAQILVQNFPKTEEANKARKLLK